MAFNKKFYHSCLTSFLIKCATTVSKVPSLGTIYLRVRPIYLWELYVTGVIFFISKLTFSNVIRTPFFPIVEIYTVNVSPSTLEFIRNKQISSHVGKELKNPTNTPPQEQCFTNTVVEHQKKC